MPEKVGVRPINNIVDVSNYIMHELGQPVHTFDYDKLFTAAGKISLQNDTENLKRMKIITTLDTKEFKLQWGDIVIEDGSEEIN